MFREKTTDSPDKLKRVCNRSMERSQIAIVYAQHIHFGTKAPKLFLRMDFEQDLKPQLVGELCKMTACLGRKDSCDKEHRICPQELGFIQLISIDNEVFTEQRQVHEEACLTQIFIFSPEETFIRQDRTGRGTGLLVGWNDRSNISIRMQPPFGRTATFELRNNRRRRRSQGGLHRTCRTRFGRRYPLL